MKVPKFTPAEQRVVRLITLGLSTKEVARVLGKAVSTVDNQRTSAMRAAEINTATLLVRVALKAGITTLDDDLTPSERRRLRLATHRGKRKTVRGRGEPAAEPAVATAAGEPRPRKPRKKQAAAAQAARRGKKSAAKARPKKAAGKPSKARRRKRRIA